MRSPTSPTRRAVVTFGKLALAGATIFGVAAALVITGPDGAVQESQADIADVLITPVTNTQRFAAALDKLGHETPRVYNYNGNDVYFSVRTSPKRPDELLREYQDEFVRQGVNERAYTAAHTRDMTKIVQEDPQQYEAMEAMLSGQIVPIYLDKERLVMQGALIKDDPKTREQFRQIASSKTPEAPEQFHDVFKSYRGIEAEWSDEDKMTTVTASWGDEDFDIRKTLPVEAGGVTEDVATDPEIPVCPGCERLTRFAGASTDKDQIAHIFATDSHPNTTLSFYERALGQRGWKETEGSVLTRKMKAHSNIQGAPEQNRQFARDGQHITLNVSFDAKQNKTLVSIHNSN